MFAWEIRISEIRIVFFTNANRSACSYNAIFCYGLSGEQSREAMVRSPLHTRPFCLFGVETILGGPTEQRWSSRATADPSIAVGAQKNGYPTRSTRNGAKSSQTRWHENVPLFFNIISYYFNRFSFLSLLLLRHDKLRRLANTARVS